MKKIALLILFAIISSTSIAQSCLPEGITFYTQQQVDNFLTNYPDCSEIEGEVKIHNSISISNLNGLQSIISIGGNLSIYYNFNLESLTGLENLASIGGNLIIGGPLYPVFAPAALTNLTGLDNLISIGGDLRISGATKLNNLSGLENLTFVGGDISIYNKPSLTSLAGLDNIIDFGGNLTIINNELLTDCDVQSICDYLALTNGSVLISNNNTGCNSVEEVEEACGIVDIAEMLPASPDLLVDCKPNPFKQSIEISYHLYKPQTVTLYFFNKFGNQVDIVEQKQSAGHQQIYWVPSHLDSGIYYYMLKASDQVANGKVIKL